MFKNTIAQDHTPCGMCQFFLVFVLSNSLFAQAYSLQTAQDAPVSPLQDDATIHDIAFAGQSLVWAVGDHGAVWNSTDAGRSWRTVAVPVGLERFTFEFVQFLTDRVGWIAGGTVSSVGRIHHGVVLGTTDGGISWNLLSQGELPYLRQVQFFDLENGIAIGERTSQYPAGMMTTADGGNTWTPHIGQENSRWNAAAFFNTETGILVGEMGRQSILTRGALLHGGGNIGGLQSIQNINVEQNGTCWMVGDGGLVLLSTDYGVTWAPPSDNIFRKLRDFTDFQSLEVKENNVWISGSPGSVIWHSANHGQTWEQQFTGSNSPISAIQFSDAQHGVAAGVFGRICTTENGGKSWTEVRGGDRRLACWTLHAQRSRVPYGFLTRWSREAGYRCGVTVTSRRDQGAEAFFSKGEGLLLEQSVLVAGGNHAAIDWRLPVSLPGLDRNSDKLAEEFSRLTDRRLPEVLLGSLVAQIRTWKPDVILIDECPADDALTKLIQQALPKAVEFASDPTKFPEHTLAGLKPWEVKKVVMERLPGRSGRLTQNSFEILPQLATTLDVATQQATSIAYEEKTSIATNRSYEILYHAPGQELSEMTVFNDLGIPPGSESRRMLSAIQPSDVERLIEEADHRRKITTITQSLVSRPDGGMQLIAQLGEMLRPLSDKQAARQLAELALKYREQSQWAMAEEAYSQLIINYPQQPDALTAMLWLVEYSTSAEMNWQRLRTVNASHSNVKVDQTIVQANFQKALELASETETLTGFNNELQYLKQGVEKNSTQLIPTLGTSVAVLNGNAQGANQYDLQLQRWQENATNIVNDLSAAFPRLFQDDEMQFVVAALLRRRQQGRRADEIYGKYLQRLNDDDPWHVAAKGETYLLRPGALSPKPVILCKQAEIAPILDGRLIDPCWSAANEVKLSEKNAQELFVGTNQELKGHVEFIQKEPIVMFSCDNDYLYIGASIPKHDGVSYAKTEQAGRPRDADLGKHDYITIQFDVDRDYATFYRFDIDQRGWSREACWDAWSYNPAWYISSDQDATSWTVEAAIPLKELLPNAPNAQSVWAVGVTRVMPGVGVQSWTNSGGEKPIAARFGFVRFE